jgi:endonuclease/exonuclease/phosphatase (EEP) superfamily protein YafD
LVAKVTGTEIQAQASNIYHKAVADYGLSTVIVLLTAVCLFTPQVLLLKQIAANTLYIMLSFLLTGIIFFLVRHERLMMISFVCCCILCIHLKSSANKQMRLAAVTANPSLNISHINLANAESEYDSVIQYILRLNTDFLSFQELTPDWKEELIKGLSGRFQYFHTMTRLDQYGMGFFSKFPLLSVDTLLYQDVPALTCAIKLDSTHKCHIISCQGIPPVSQAAFSVIDGHFNYLSEYMEQIDGSVIVLGDLHLPPWASEIQRFKSMSQLQDSRRDINPRHLDGSVSLPRIPVEHIFYCEKFECTSFSEVGNDSIGSIGITGTYQLHNGYAEVAQ